MTCAEARLFLDQGVLPGSTQRRHPQLGFHLATCDNCRAYRNERDQTLLAELIAMSPARSAAPQSPRGTAESATLRPTPVLRVGRQPEPTQRLKYAALLVAGLLVSALTLAGWYIGLPLWRAYGNLQSSYRPSAPEPVNNVVLAPASESPTPVILPTATRTPNPTVRPSLTPLPTATPTTAPTATPEPTATPMPTPTPTLPPAQALTIALLGLDARPGEGLQARSDALMLVRLDPQANSAALLSMPRDIWVPIPGYGEGKINGAFYHGERSAPGGGLDLAEQTLGQAFGVQVDHAVVIDFKGFRSLIDALDGITVDVPKEIYDGHFPTDDYGYTVAHFLPGPQQMDGATALTYARTRHPDSDFERIKRQQLVLLGIARKLKERGALQNLHEADVLTRALAPFVVTDMPPDAVLSLLWSMRDVDPAKVQRYTVDSSLLWETSVGGAYALVPRQGTLKTLGQKLLAPATP
ncbi:MAG: LCP family protein [Chloroflexota bacterium]|nr:LCP family protein [Chloroflexota bacterium]